MDYEGNAISGWCCTHPLTNARGIMKEMLVVGVVLYALFWRGLFFALVFYSWHELIYLYYPPPLLRTHLTTVIEVFFADVHGLTRKCCWWVVLYTPTNNPHSRTKPFPPSHESRFLRWHASLDSESDPRTYSGTYKYWKTRQVERSS